jgi:hypothetical protein
VRVLSGQRIELLAQAEARTLAAPPGSSVFLQAWPGAVLGLRDKRYELPGGDDPLRVLIRTAVGPGWHFAEEWVKESEVTVAPEPLWRREVAVIDGEGVPVAGAQVLLVREPPGGSRLESLCPTDSRGQAIVVGGAAPTPRVVVVQATGFAARVLFLPPEGPIQVRLERGHNAGLRVLDPRGEPAAETAVRVLQPASPLLDRTFWTDGSGRVVLPDLPLGPALVRVVHPTILDREYPVEIRDGGGEPQVLRGEAGFRVFGTVLLPDGRPAAGALVSLRDPTGSTGLRERTTTANADGDFQILGLPEAVNLLLAVSLRRDGTTFISQQTMVQAGDGGWNIELKTEDPGTRRIKRQGRPGQYSRVARRRR